jgi:hypothetical protein
MAEAYRKWELIEGIIWPCAQVDFFCVKGEVVLRCLFSFTADGPDKDVLLHIDRDRVICFTSWEEFAHPWNADPPGYDLPIIGGEGRWGGYSYPFLEVVDSRMIAGLVDTQGYADPATRHLRIVTFDHTVDVLATEVPWAEWVDGPE